MAAVIREVEPLPLVPVMWTIGYVVCGSPKRPEKGPYPIEARQPEMPGPSGLDRFEVYVSVEPRQRLA